jgi:hypothetical protein
VFGDPHFVSLDGHKFTFNGHGEFTLLQTPDDAVNVQLRMVEPPHDSEFIDEGGSIATAVVAKHKHSDTVQFELVDNKLIAYVNGDVLDLSTLSEQEFENLTIIIVDNNTLSVEFFSGITIVVKERKVLLELHITVFDHYYYQTQGLLGRYNGNYTDDLLPRNKTDPLPINSDIREIHYNFGMTWIVNEPRESLFTYQSKGGWDTFHKPKFVPLFDIVFPDNATETEAHEVCESDQYCLYDIAATGIIDIGISTKDTQTSQSNISQYFTPIICDPPCSFGACVRHDSCYCSNGFIGDLCEHAVYHECDENYCLNGANCVIHADDYICNCTEGFSGPFCGIGNHSLLMKSEDFDGISSYPTHQQITDDLSFVTIQKSSYSMTEELIYTASLNPTRLTQIISDELSYQHIISSVISSSVHENFDTFSDFTSNVHISTISITPFPAETSTSFTDESSQSFLLADKDILPTYETDSFFVNSFTSIFETIYKNDEISSIELETFYTVATDNSYTISEHVTSVDDIKPTLSEESASEILIKSTYDGIVDETPLSSQIYSSIDEISYSGSIAGESTIAVPVDSISPSFTYDGIDSIALLTPHPTINNQILTSSNEKSYIGSVSAGSKPTNLFSDVPISHVLEKSDIIAFDETTRIILSDLHSSTTEEDVSSDSLSPTLIALSPTIVNHGVVAVAVSATVGGCALLVLIVSIIVILVLVWINQQFKRGIYVLEHIEIEKKY